MRKTVRAVKRWYRSEVLTPLRLLFIKDKIYKSFNKITIPPTLYIECTNVCNALCVFCAYPIVKDSVENNTMSLELFNNILTSYISAGGLKIALTPTVGDPLVDKLFTDRLHIIDDTPIKHVHFYTNLIDFRKDHIHMLQNIKNTIIEVNISITGFNKPKYSKYMGVDKFDRVIRNLKRLSTITNPLIKKNITLRDYEDSTSEKKSLIDFLNRHKLAYSLNTEYDSWGGLVKNLFIEHAELEQQRIKTRYGPCQISYTKPVITVDGILKLCDCRDVNNELIIGEITTDNFLKLWHSEHTKSLREKMYARNTTPKICQQCELYTSIYDPDSVQIINKKTKSIGKSQSNTL